MDIPQILPGGETLWVDHEFMKKLKEGAPEVGWTGDDRLGVYFGNDCMEIRRADDHGNMRLIMRSRPGLRTLGMEALIFLAEHDSQSRKQYDVVRDINEHNDRVRSERESRNADKRGEAVERLAHALLKDAGAYEGGSTRRFFSGVDVPKKGRG